jgi:hypothetical protein
MSGREEIYDHCPLRLNAVPNHSDKAARLGWVIVLGDLDWLQEKPQSRHEESESPNETSSNQCKKAPLSAAESLAVQPFGTAGMRN